MTGVIIRWNESFERALSKFTEKVGTTPIQKSERKAKVKVRRKMLSNIYG